MSTRAYVTKPDSKDSANSGLPEATHPTRLTTVQSGISAEKPSRFRNLPRPRFSPSNPYWQKLEIKGLTPAYQPRLNWRDFLYASMWEKNCPDPHGALCVRWAWQLTVAINFKQSIRNQIKETLYDEKQK